ncbi:hypothetical protein BGZ49_010150 [Haplosporangium sp. Z 27]|nr:hypothetical protein BGZ49_010150 [Haplosporangium sp. Z 27]
MVLMYREFVSSHQHYIIYTEGSRDGTTKAIERENIKRLLFRGAKIKCDVDKGIPCKNCERNAVQCTLVGPAMRPPRNISGSTSAAAAVAVAVAVATAAAANAQTGAGPAINSSNGGDVNSDRPTNIEEPATDLEIEPGVIRAPTLLVRRASASGQLMRADEGASGTIDVETSKRRRSLLSSSSSPTSLRALFNAGSNTIRSPTLTSSESTFQVDSLNITNPIENSLSNQRSGSKDVRTALAAGNSTGIDYFDHPTNYSGSSSNSSTPSGAMMANGIPHFAYSVDSLPSTVAHLISPLSSPLCHAQPLSLPPTPLQLMGERLPESIMAGGLISGLGTYPQGHNQFQTPTPRPRYGTARRASSSSYVPSGYSTDNEIKVQQHDRRTSAPWASYHSPSLPYDNRHLSQAQTSSTGMQSHHYGGAIHSIMKSHATTDDIQPYSTQSNLMRSNSTPAALRSPLKSLNRNRHSALSSRRSHIVPTRQSLNLYASTDKVIQDLSLPQKLYRNSALPQRHINNMSHLQFQLHLQQLQQQSQQLQQSQQNGQRSQSLPRFQPDHSHRSPSQSNIFQWQGYGASQQLQQEADINFDLGIDNSHDVEMSIKSLPLGHSMPLGLDSSLDIPPTDMISSIDANSPTHSTIGDFQSFGSHLAPPLDLGLGEDRNSNSSISGITPQELLAHQHIHQQPPPEEQSSKLQFAPGYAWKQEPDSDRIVNGHTRHQSASQVYPQPPLQFQPSTQQRANFTRSLQDLTRYTTVLVDQHQIPDQARFLAQEASMPQATTHDQNASQDNFGASLAVDLHDHLRLLDDMDAMPEFNEFGNIPRTSLLATEQSNKETLLHSSGIPNHSNQSILGSSATGSALNQDGQRSIFSSITSSHNPLLLNGASINSTLGQSTEIHHFHGGPYIDTLSFLDLSGSFMNSTPGGAPMASAATSSSLPNTSFLDQQGDRLYNGFVPNVQQQSLPPTLQNPLALQTPQGHQAPPHLPQQQPLPQQQQHIIHHHYHHHHIH